MHDLPRWNLANIYPDLDSPAYVAAVRDYEAGLTALEADFDRHGVRRIEPAALPTSAAIAHTLETLIPALEDSLRLGETLTAYLYGLITTDSYDAQAARENSRLEMIGARRRGLDVRLNGWLGAVDARLSEVLQASPFLREREFFLRYNAEQSRYQMDEPCEALAAELCLDGGTAFGRLHGTITSQLKVPFERDGKTEELPISMVRNLCFDPDPDVRERAYNAELAGWKSIGTTVAACLNGVKGTALTLAKKRGRAEVLDAALDQNRIDRPTLDAMLGAIREFFPVFRRYYQAKAEKLGRDVLPWWDLNAPLGQAERRFSWSEARTFLVEKFGKFSPDLGAFAARTFDERWIDAEPRVGKRNGAYCMAIPGLEESRVLANYDGSFEQLMTLAHELGHAFHNDCQNGLAMSLRGSPATLAETASIFCETLTAEAALVEAGPGERLMILEAQVGNAAQVCVDISSRFLFESAVFAKRPQGELSPEEFCDLMKAAQAETYGPAIDPATYHPYMWLWKQHYYGHEDNFYNFPYAFGHLFGLGLYAVYRREGEAFVPRYRALLRDTARDWAAPLAARFGLDLRDREFWRGSLREVEGMVERFEAC